jgi:hypothetical protein
MMSFLPSLCLLIAEGGKLNFSHWIYQVESQGYVLHSKTMLEDSPDYRGGLSPIVHLQDALFLGYKSQQIEHLPQPQDAWVIVRLDSIPQPGQEAIASSTIRTFQSLGGIATDGQFLWVGAEATLMLLDQNLETLDQVSLEGSWSSIRGKNAHDILAHQKTGYLLDNLIFPALLFQFKANNAQKLKLVRVLKLEGVYIHLDRQWLNPQLNHWIVLESGSSGYSGTWQVANIFPMHWTETDNSHQLPYNSHAHPITRQLLFATKDSMYREKHLERFEVVAVTHLPPTWAVIYSVELKDYCLTLLDSANNQITVGFKLPLEWGERDELRERDELSKIILKNKENFLVVIDCNYNQMVIVDIERDPQIVHRQSLGYRKRRIPTVQELL